MKGVNKVTLLGNLGCDPEMRYTAKGVACARFKLATSQLPATKAQAVVVGACEG